MEKSPARPRLVPVVYGGAVIVLLVLAVFARGFTQNVGDARVSGRYTIFPLFSSRVPERLTVSWNGFALHFSRSATPTVSGFAAVPDAAEIQLDGDARLRLSAGRDVGGSLFLSAASGAAGSAIVIPYTLSGIPREPPAGAALAWQEAGRLYTLTLPAGATVDSSSRTLRLPVGAAGQATLARAGTTAVAATARAVPVTAPARQQARLPDEKSMPGADQLAASLGAFTDRAFAGWSKARLAASGGQWVLPDGSTGFSESIGVGLLAESIARGSWQRFFPAWSDALDAERQRAPGAALTLETSTYVGGVRDWARAAQASAATRLAQATALIGASDTAALAVDGLVPLVMARGTADQLSAAEAFLVGRATAGLDVGSALGLLEDLLDYAEQTTAAEPVLRALKAVIDRPLMPAVRTTDAGVFLESDKGQSSVADSIRCGSLFLRAGKVLDSSFISAVGRGLVVAGLGLADDVGMMPATLAIAGGKVGAREGKLGAESIYAELPLDRRVPRLTPLKRQIGQGAWIWTSARVVSVDATATGLRVVLGFPAGILCNTVIQGVKDFSVIRLHGIPWHTDPTYYTYSDGWAWDGESRTFYLKITGRADQEEVDFVY